MEEENNTPEDICYTEKLKALIEQELEQFSDAELNSENLDVLYKLVDIDKDLENIDYWNFKKEVMKMRYNNYGEYDEGRYGEYSNYGNYGRRNMSGPNRGGYHNNYSEGEEMIDTMRESYGAYSDSMNAYNRGNYAAGQDGMKALEDTMEIFTEFAQKMINEVTSPEGKQIIKKHLHRISQMG